jgi:hypothetical protein
MVAPGVPVKLMMAGVPEQTGELVETEAAGKAFTVTVAEPESAALQPLSVEDSALTSIYVILEAGLAALRVAVPDASSVIDWFAPAPILYVTMAFGVPVKVMMLDWPEQIVAGLALTDAVGMGTAVTVIDWDSAWVQTPPTSTFVSVKTVVAVRFGNTADAVPDASKLTECTIPAAE